MAVRTETWTWTWTAASALAVILAAPRSAPAQEVAGATHREPPAEAPPVAELERRLTEQQRELDALREEVRRLGGDAGGMERREGAPAQPGRPLAGPIRLGLFFIESADGQHRLELNGRLQVDGRFVVGRAHEAVDATFLVRRARFEVSGKVFERMTFKLGLEFGRTSDADLRDAYLDLRAFEWARLRVGQMLPPFSTERLTSSNVMKLPERPMIVGLIAESREIGLMLHGSFLDRRLSYAVGFYNGNGQNVGKDDDDDKDAAVRLEVAPIHALLFAASYRYTPPNRAHSRGPADAATVGNQLTTFLDYDTGRNRHVGSRERGSLDLRARLGPLEVKAELLWDYFRDVRSAAGREADLLTWGWFVDGSVVLTGEESQDVIDPARPLWGGSGPGTGAFELVVRYEELHADRRVVADGFAAGAREVRAATVGLTWIPVKRVRLLLAYTYSDFGTAIANADGQPQTDEHALVARIGLWF